MNRRNQQMPHWVAFIFLLLGAYIILLSLGVLPYIPSKRKRGVFHSPQHWQITSIGVAFFCADIAIAFGNRRHWLLTLNGIVLLTNRIRSPRVLGFAFFGESKSPGSGFRLCCDVIGIGRRVVWLGTHSPRNVNNSKSQVARWVNSFIVCPTSALTPSPMLGLTKRAQPTGCMICYTSLSTISTSPIQFRFRRARRASSFSPSNDAAARFINNGSTPSNALTLTTA
jgi:hypothetical protein